MILRVCKSTNKHGLEPWAFADGSEGEIKSLENELRQLTKDKSEGST